MNQDQLERYTKTLNIALHGIYKLADDLVKTLPDTLDDDFQIACEIRDVFVKYARKNHFDVEFFP